MCIYACMHVYAYIYMYMYIFVLSLANHFREKVEVFPFSSTYHCSFSHFHIA